MIQILIAKLLSKVVMAVIVMAALEMFTPINALSWFIQILETVLWDMFGNEVKNYVIDRVAFW